MTRRTPRIANFASAAWALPVIAVVLAVAAGRERASAANLEHVLQTPVTVSWRGQELGAALQRLATSLRAPLWIDRRVDVAAPVDFAATNQPFAAVVQGAGADLQIDAVAFGPLVYLGPRATTADLATLSARARDAVAKLPPDVRRRWLESDKCAWPRLSEPRLLIADLAASADAKVLDAELIPHDLWPARNFPAMPRVDRLVLLLAGFELTCEFPAGGSAVQIVPLRRPVTITRDYRVPAARRAEFEKAVAAAKDAKLESRPGRDRVVARWEEHERFRAAIAGRPSPPTRSDPPAPGPSRPDLRTQRFTLKIQNQRLGRVLDELARQLALDVKWDDPLLAESPSRADVLASCDVRQADLDELLTALVNPTGLVYERDGRRIRIRAAP